MWWSGVSVIGVFMGTVTSVDSGFRSVCFSFLISWNPRGKCFSFCSTGAEGPASGPGQTDTMGPPSSSVVARRTTKQAGASPPPPTPQSQGPSPFTPSAPSRRTSVLIAQRPQMIEWPCDGGARSRCHGADGPHLTPLVDSCCLHRFP